MRESFERSFEMMSDEEIVRRATQGQGETESGEEGVETDTQRCSQPFGMPS